MTEQSHTVSGIRVTHRRASVGQLEAATPRDPQARAAALLERDDVSEAFVLVTCNRVEEYVVAATADVGRDALGGLERRVPPGLLIEMGHQESLRHLLRVAAGLESQVLGEDGIIGQLRRAYREAEAAGSLGPVLESTLLKAIHVGERARTETGINDGTVSLGGAAVRLAEREVGLGDRVVLVIGAGETAGTVVRALARPPVAEVRLVNRSTDRARSLADELPMRVQIGSLDALARHLGDAEIVFSATSSSEHVIDPELATRAEDALVIDLAQPRDIAPASADRVTLRDLDDLRSITRETHDDRRAAAEAVEAIIDEELELLLDQLKRRRADAVIAAMYRGAERMKQREVDEAIGKLEAAGELESEERRIVEAMAESLVAKLLAVPTRSLREAAANDDWETIATAIELFDPNVDDGSRRMLLEAAAEAAATADVSED